MSESTLPKGYEPKDVEARWIAHWESDKTFTPDLNGPDAPGEPYSIVIPPPNVTGALHMGHAPEPHHSGYPVPLLPPAGP